MAKTLRIKSSGFAIVAYVIILVTYLFNIGVLGGTMLSVDLGRDIFTTLLHPLMLFQLQHPYVSLSLSLAMIVLGALLAMRLSISFSLYGTASHLPSVIYPATIALLITPSQILIAPLVALLSLLSLFKFFDAYNAPASTHKLFSALFWCGVILMIYPSAIILIGTLFLAMTMFGRELREFLVGAWALLLPTLMALYVGWLCGYDIGYMLDWQADQLFSHSYSFREKLPEVLFVGVTLLFALIGASRVDNISIALVSRTRIIFSAMMTLLLVFMLALPSFSPIHFVVAAAPASIAVSTMFLTMRDRWATISYVIYLLLVVLVAQSDAIFRLFNN